MSYHWHGDDAPDVVLFGNRTQRAKKAHRCETCPLPGRATIPVGQEYRRLTGTTDGEFFVVRECVGGCPHAVDCSACGGTGLEKAGEYFGDGCPKCGGIGKFRAPDDHSDDPQP